VLWFFANQSETVQIVTYVDTNTREFVVDIEWPAGHSTSERFNEKELFRERLVGLEEELERGGYHAVGRPEILPRNWRGDPM
jgi:hypothetical protein